MRVAIKKQEYSLHAKAALRLNVIHLFKVAKIIVTYTFQERFKKRA